MSIVGPVLDLLDAPLEVAAPGCERLGGLITDGPTRGHDILIQTVGDVIEMLRHADKAFDTLLYLLHVVKDLFAQLCVPFRLL